MRDNILDKRGPSILYHFFNMKTDLLRAVYARKQSRSHAGIIMIGRRTNQRYPMPPMHIRMKIEHDRHMGMPAANEHQMLSHLPSFYFSTGLSAFLQHRLRFA